jgi:hypothetical protein
LVAEKRSKKWDDPEYKERARQHGLKGLQVSIERLADPELAAEYEKREAKRRLWRKGELSWKFQRHPWGKDMYDFVRAHWGQHVHFRVHRRGIKSSTGLIIGIEECLRAKGIDVAVVCKTERQVQNIIDRLLLPLLEDCPRNYQPRRIKNDFSYVFDHNNSKISILPTDSQNFTKARGRKFRYILIMEAGFIPDLDVIVKQVLAPTTRDVLGEWRGTIVMESNRAEGPGHPWIKLYEEAELEGRTFYLPLSKNKYAAPSFVQECKDDCGGEDTIEYRAEYECEWVFDDESTVIPEFTQRRAFEGDEAKKLPPIVRELPRPAGSDLYASLDPGGRHTTGHLWGYYHFEMDTVVIEEELMLPNMTSDDLAVKLKEKELALWEKPERVTRIADNNNVILLYDLARLHGLRYLATAKDNKDAQINQVRVMVREGRIAIHPRCRTLIKTMRLAKRTETARGLSFVEMDEIGHADLLDALIYLVRNVKRHTMTVAAPMSHVARDWAPTQPKRSQAGDVLARALGLGRRR